MSTIKGLPGFTHPYPCTDKKRSSSIYFLYLHHPGSLHKNVPVILFRKSHYFYVKTNTRSSELKTCPSKESAKLRAKRAKNVPTCKRALHSYVLTYQRALSAYVPHVSTCLTCLWTQVPAWLVSSRAPVTTSLESFPSHGLRLLDHVITCQHVLPPQ